jgi:hypothetical protein
MFAYDIKIDGLNKVQGNFEQRAKKTAKCVETIIKKAIFLVERYAKIAAPVRTGRLRASIGGGGYKGGSFGSGEGMELHPTWGSIMPTVKYAPFVHQRNPFMKRGIANADQEIQQMAQTEVNNAIK